MRSSVRKFWIVPVVFGIGVLLLWVFPKFWYTGAGDGERIWFAEAAEVKGWTYEPVPIAESAERALVADRIFNGEFRNGQSEPVRVFSAKRFVENQNEIGLFVHTPDRCWAEGGWKIEPTSPEVCDLSVHGVQIKAERRIYQFGGNRELVYFWGTVDGQVLPYRLDHNLGVGINDGVRVSRVQRMMRRATDGLLWQRLWTSFQSRRALAGPKHFVRISTPITAATAEGIAEADQRLKGFVTEWLRPGDYAEERRMISHTSELIIDASLYDGTQSHKGRHEGGRKGGREKG